MDAGISRLLLPPTLGRISAQKEGCLIPTVQVPVPLTALLMAVIKQLLPAELHEFMQQLAAWQQHNGQ